MPVTGGSQHQGVLTSRCCYPQPGSGRRGKESIVRSMRSAARARSLVGVIDSSDRSSETARAHVAADPHPRPPSSSSGSDTSGHGGASFGALSDVSRTSSPSSCRPSAESTRCRTGRRVPLRGRDPGDRRLRPRWRAHRRRHRGDRTTTPRRSGHRRCAADGGSPPVASEDGEAAEVFVPIETVLRGR